MTLALYVPAPTVLHRLHPVTKLFVFVAFVVAAFVVDHPLGQLPLAALVLALVVAGQGVANLRRFRVMFVIVFVFTVVIWTFFFRSTLYPTRAGLLFGLSTAIRLETFLAAGILFLTTTRVEEVAYALGRLGVPYTVGFTLTLAFRLVPVFFDAALTIVQAQRCRGLEFGRGGVWTRLSRYVPVLVPVFVGALRRADRMAMALELRGFNSGRPRTTYLRAEAGRADLAAAIVAAGVASGYVALWARGTGLLGPRLP
ncbi:MAG: energy-coupling factor transporter transmembrane component T [Candidatus Binatia bacterium]